MSSTKPLLIQVVPQLKPGRCGVTDHAIPLANELRSTFGIDSAFVVLNSKERCDLAYEVMHCEAERLFESCAALGKGQPQAILAHVSGYGYSPDGAPTRLADALSSTREDRFAIAAFFHEISASGAPWSAAFWQSRRQEQAVRRIAEACDLLVTNLGVHARWLEERTNRRPEARICLLPVFSTIGEAHGRIMLAKRVPAMVVFGLPGTRQRAYRELSRLPEIFSSLQIENIVDIGAGTDSPGSLHGIPVIRKGELGAAELCGELSRARFGYLSYPANCLAKSSVFAAYCAQGTIPVIAKPFGGEIDGLRDGVHLLSPGTTHRALASGLDASGLESCSLAAWQWYCGHGIHVHAETYARWLGHPATAREGEEARR